MPWLLRLLSSPPHPTSVPPPQGSHPVLPGSLSCNPVNSLPLTPFLASSFRCPLLVPSKREQLNSKGRGQRTDGPHSSLLLDSHLPLLAGSLRPRVSAFYASVILFHSHYKSPPNVSFAGQIPLSLSLSLPLRSLPILLPLSIVIWT